MKKKKVIIAILVILIAVSTALIKILSTPKHFDKAQQQYNENYPSLNYENEVSQRLARLNIAHKIDGSGVLCYFGKDENIVEKTYEEVDKKYFPEWPNIYLANTKRREAFEALLKKENIPYIKRKLDSRGKDYILWDPFYADKGLDLKKRVLEKVDRR